MFRWLLIPVLLTVVGCGTDTRSRPGGNPEDSAGVDAGEGDTDACEGGDEKTEACGQNGAGIQVMTCVDGDWSEPGPCVDPDDCASGETKTEACGLNGAGTRSATCASGRWEAWGTCDDPDECANDSERQEPCGRNERGSRVGLCEAGAWGEFGACVDPDVCVDDAIEIEPCVSDADQVQSRTCAAGQWGEPGSCREVGSCYPEVRAGLSATLATDTANACADCCFWQHPPSDDEDRRSPCALGCMLAGTSTNQCNRDVVSIGIGEACGACYATFGTCVLRLWEGCFDVCRERGNEECKSCQVNHCAPELIACGGVEYYCDNGEDDNADGQVDCADPSCAGDPACEG